MHIPQTEIILRHDGAELARVTLPPGEYVIGRDPGAPIHAETPRLSRQHARLTINYDHLLLEDLGSSHGTFINEQPVTEATRLFPNQSIRLGDLAIEVRRQRAPLEPGITLTPTETAIRRHLPDELLAEKRYAIGSVVAQGGMGAILDARQTAIDRTVAMKVMLETGDEAAVLRFIDEAKITGQLDHPNIVPIYELGVDEQGQLFYTMKMVRGITLRKVLELLAAGNAETVKKYPLPVLLTVFQKVCDALAFAHSKGVIHRDLKPENLMLGDFGSVLVMDWGLAKIIGQNDAPGRSVRRSGVVTVRAAEPELSATMTGSIMGTPAYMSPEQARGEIETLDARSDIYALGTILFEILALRPPVSGANALEIVEKVQRGEIESLENLTPRRKDAKEDPSHAAQSPAFAPLRLGASHLPSGRLSASLAAVVRKAMAFERAARYPRVEDLQADLLAYQTGFATGAEHAGAWKQFTLFVRRNKAVATSLAVALAVLAAVSGAFTLRVISEKNRAENALADLKKTAPALRQLAETEAGFQRFDSALTKLDAALVLDPALPGAWWRRAWLLIGKEDFTAAAAAIRTAQQRDGAHPEWAAILLTIEQLAAVPAADRWTPERAQALHEHLVKAGASGEVGALAVKMRLGTDVKVKLIRARLDAWLGKDEGRIRVTDAGLIEVTALPRTISTLEPLHGLLINGLNIEHTAITDLEPLRGMPLARIEISHTKISSLEPLRGMRLTRIGAYDCSNLADCSPLSGMPLKEVHANESPISDLSFLAGAPLEKFHCVTIPSAIRDISPLRGLPLRILRVSGDVSSLEALADAPLEELQIGGSFTDLAPLQGKRLRELIVGGRVIDASPLRGAPIEQLEFGPLPLLDCRPLLDLPKLKTLRISSGQRGLEVLKQHPTLQFIQFIFTTESLPVAEFWPKYDALVAAEKQAAKEKLAALIATRSKTMPDGTLELDCSKQGLRVVAGLEGMKVSKLTLDENGLRYLSGLDGLPLKKLSLRNNWDLHDLSPLRGLPLRALHLYKTNVSDLSPLRGMPLEWLYFDATPVKDLRPLLEMPKLRRAMIPRAATNIEVLRPLTQLEYLGWEDDWQGDKDFGHPRLTPAEFWKRYDALKAGKK